MVIQIEFAKVGIITVSHLDVFLVSEWLLKILLDFKLVL